jgi:hypothetical protein
LDLSRGADLIVSTAKKHPDQPVGEIASPLRYQGVRN